MANKRRKSNSEPRRTAHTLLPLLEFRALRNYAAKNSIFMTQAVRHFMRYGGFDAVVEEQRAIEQISDDSD